MQKRKKILLVEDSRFTAKVVAELLNKNGFETETAVTGEEAVQKISGGSSPDLVLMDIELAGEMDGIDAARRILKSRDIPVVFLTANTSGEIIDKIKEVKAYGFVLKDTDKVGLLSTVEMALKLHEANIHARMFERLFENSLNELYIFHPKSFKFVAVNCAARKNLGYTIEELNTMTPLDLKPELDLQSFRELLNSLVSGEQEQVLFNTVHRRKDGSLYPVQINLQLFDYGGEKLCLALVVDLTERRAMEEELKEKQATLNAILGSAREAIVMLDGQGNVTFWNPAAEQLFGYSPEEILGKDLHQLVVPDEHVYEVYSQAFKHFQSSGEGNAIGKTIELKAKHKDGRELDVELSLSALRFRNTWHAVGIVRDISERKQAQEELENSRKQYIELAEEAPIGILKCDLEGNIIYVNQKTLEILGSPSIEETKKINLLTYPLLARYGFSRKLEECLQNNKPGIYEMNYESKWGKKVWLRAHVKPLVNRNTVIGAQIIIDDITERKQLEELNRRKEERFRLMLEGIPSPAWLISRERRILAQNRAAEMVGPKIGNYCWGSIHGTKSLPDECRKVIEKSGTPLPGTKCYFCRGDEALDKNAPINSEVEFAGGIWDTWWIPLGEDVYLHYAVDVTKYKKMEEELRQREEFLQLLLTSMPTGVIIIDALSYRIENVNLEAAAMIGAAPEEIIGKTCFEFFPHSKGCCPVINLGQDVNRAERILHRADGAEIPVLKTVKRLQTDSGEKLIETFMDLTERKKMEEQLYRLSISDPLTNAYNRRYFMQVLEQEMERAKRADRKFSMIMLDIDRFKSINDRFGHNAGDLVLKSIAELIKNRIRKIDTLARWGGEEFVILLPDTTVKNAALLAEELRESLNRMNIPGVGSVTASFGVAGYCPGDMVDTLVNKADNMMYEAKAAGRNCVRYMNVNSY